MRTLLLFCVLLALPVLFFACYPCGKGSGHGFWTLGSADIHSLNNDLQTELFSGDTISGDSLYFRVQLNTMFLSQQTIGYNPYSAMACSPVDPTQTNKVVKINWGLKYPGNDQLDTSISNSLSIASGLMQWQWTMQKAEFIQELSGEFSMPRSIIVKVQSPHRQSNIQLMVHLMKQNGDTLVTSGPVVYCK